MTKRSASARTEFIMAKLDNTIEELAHRIFSKEEYFLYKGMKFLIQETNYSSPMDMRELTVLRILCPMPYMNDDERYISVTYENDRLHSEHDRDTRIEACVRLATHFVMDVLPKVDYDLKKELTNYEIDNILSVLD